MYDFGTREGNVAGKDEIELRALNVCNVERERIHPECRRICWLDFVFCLLFVPTGIDLLRLQINSHPGPAWRVDVVLDFLCLCLEQVCFFFSSVRNEPKPQVLHATDESLRRDLALDGLSVTSNELGADVKYPLGMEDLSRSLTLLPLG